MFAVSHSLFKIFSRKLFFTYNIIFNLNQWFFEKDTKTQGFLLLIYSCLLLLYIFVKKF